MMKTQTVVDLETYRKRKSNERVFEALEQFHRDVVLSLEAEGQQMTGDELEAFMVQVLAEHLVGNLQSTSDRGALDENFQRFNGRLRQCVQIKLRSLELFEKVQRQ